MEPKYPCLLDEPVLTSRHEMMIWYLECSQVLGCSSRGLIVEVGRCKQEEAGVMPRRYQNCQREPGIPRGKKMF